MLVWNNGEMMLTGEHRMKKEKWWKTADRGKPSEYGEMMK
jgi:hypothetical protein